MRKDELEPIPTDDLLTDEVQQRIIECLRRVRHFSRACKLAGVPWQAASRWLRLGKNPGAPDKFKRFTEAVHAEQKIVEKDCVDAIMAASKDPMQWKAAAWMLERIQPNEWGEREKIAHKKKEEKTLQNQPADTTQILTAVLAVLVKFPEARLEVANALKQLKAIPEPEE